MLTAVGVGGEAGDLLLIEEGTAVGVTERVVDMVGTNEGVLVVGFTVTFVGDLEGEEVAAVSTGVVVCNDVPPAATAATAGGGMCADRDIIGGDIALLLLLLLLEVGKTWF